MPPQLKQFNEEMEREFEELEQKPLPIIEHVCQGWTDNSWMDENTATVDFTSVKSFLSSSTTQAWNKALEVVKAEIGEDVDSYTGSPERDSFMDGINQERARLRNLIDSLISKE